MLKQDTLTKTIRSVSTPEKWLPGPLLYQQFSVVHVTLSISWSQSQTRPPTPARSALRVTRSEAADSDAATASRSYRSHWPAQRNLTRIVAGGESAGRGKRGPSPAGRPGRRRVLPEGGRHQCHTIPSPSRPPPPPPSTRALLSQLPRADVLDSANAPRDPPHAPAALALLRLESAVPRRHRRPCRPC